MSPVLPAGQALSQAQACLQAGDRAQALQLLQAASASHPNHADLQAGLGVALRCNGQLAAAAQAFERALACQPGHAQAQVSLGMIRLAQGRQVEGWRLYQARWQAPHWTEKLRYPASALWHGQARPGLRLLLWGEQGLGDTLQFVRYAPWLWRLLRSQGATLVLEVPAGLCALLRAAWPFMEMVAAGQPRGHFDAHLPLMDLPWRWGGVVGPGGLPYQPLPAPYLSALPDVWAAQRGALALALAHSQVRTPLRVGIVWQGRPTHPDDRWRSMALAELAGLWALPGIRWVSLQKDGGAHPAWLPQDMAGCADFADTARIVAGLDLVISIDSAVAHLAGALGRPVWLLLPTVADWRWQLQGDTTPWYPQMRLFRQGAGESWGPVLGRVAGALALHTTHHEV